MAQADCHCDKTVAVLSLGGDVTHTIVKWPRSCEFISEMTDVTTEYLNPHDPCDCVKALHPEKFKLRMTTKSRFAITRIYRNASIYIMCEPEIPIRGELEDDYMHAAEETRVEYVGWKYLGTVHYSDYVGSCGENMLTLKLYVDNMKGIPEIPVKVKHTLSASLTKLLDKGTYSDITLSSEGGTAFNAHRCILAERSEMFAAMFKHDNTEYKANISTSLNNQTLSQMLTYIYTDKTPDPKHITDDLFVASDYYQLDDLKTICVAGLCSQVQVENAVMKLEHAIQVNHHKMLQFTIDYIKQNINLIANTEDWKNMKSVDVMKVIFQNGMKP